MAGAFKLRKKLEEKIDELISAAKSGTMEGEWSVEEAASCIKEVEMCLHQHQDTCAVIADGHKLWNEPEKLEKLRMKEEKVVEKAHKLCEVVRMYIDKSTHTMEQLHSFIETDKMSITRRPRAAVPVDTAKLDQQPVAGELDSLRHENTVIEREMEKLRLTQLGTEKRIQAATDETETRLKQMFQAGFPPIPGYASTFQPEFMSTPDVKESDDEALRSDGKALSAEAVNKHLDYRSEQMDPAPEERYSSVRKRRLLPQTPQGGEPLSDKYLNPTGPIPRRAPPIHTENMSLFGQNKDVSEYLTKIPLNKFKGDKRQFEGWWSAFLACVDSADSPAVVKMLKLRSCLEDSALDAISSLQCTEMGYTIAKQRLERKYGGVRRRLAVRYEEISSFKPIREENPEDLEKFAEMLDGLVVSLAEQGDTGELGSGTLYHCIMRKLSASHLQRFQRWLFEQRKEGNVMLLRDFINQEALFAVTASEMVKGLGTDRSRKEGKSRDSNKNTKTFFGKVESEKTSKKGQFQCKLCKEMHGLWNCTKFKGLTPSERADKVRELGACYKCLQTNHQWSKCFRTKGCSVKGCVKDHHWMLHGSVKSRSEVSPATNAGDKTQSANKPEGVAAKSTMSSDASVGTDDLDSSQTMEKQTYSTTKNTSYEGLVLFRTVPIILRNLDRSVRVNALLDSASNCSYISEDVASYLRLEGDTGSINVNAVNNSRRRIRSSEVSCELESVDGNVMRRFYAQTLPVVCSTIKAVDVTKIKRKWSHLADIPFPRPAGDKVDVLIGLDYPRLLKSEGDVEGDEGSPIARRTVLGWTCTGILDSNRSLTTMITVNCSTAEVEKLNQNVRAFWEMESVPETKFVKPEEKAALKIAEETISYDGERYKIGIPWKAGRPTGVSNYHAAVAQLKGTTRRFRKQPELGKACHEIIEEYRRDGITRKLPASAADDADAFYLGIFPVVREGVETTAVRMVCHASQKFKGISLNDMIYIGPKLQQDLIHVLLGFRQYQYGLSSDVAKMYSQILMLEADRPYQRFVWRGPDGLGDIEIYEFTRVVFGMNCSPFLAQYVSRVNADRCEKENPIGARVVKERTYMDDGLDSSPTEADGIEKRKKVQEVWDKASMKVHKWISNSKAILETIPPESRGKKVDLTKGELPRSKSLGVYWDPEKDMLIIETSMKKYTIPGTKREFLSLLAGLFDPLGLVAPVIITGKVLLQRCWEQGVDWDDRLSEGLMSQVIEWYKGMQALQAFEIPRVLQLFPDGTMMIHAFSDACDDSYGAVVYSSNKDITGQIWTNLVIAKSRVAPVTTVCIPRLELMGAVLAAQLVEKVVKSLELPMTVVIFWVDSIDVWYWVRGRSKDFKPFVANRVGVIQRISEPETWKYVPTGDNPADMLSRGLVGDKLKDSTIWRKGPEFIAKDESDWPDQSIIPPMKETTEKKKHMLWTFATGKEPESKEMLRPDVTLQGTRLEPSRYSSWSRLVGVLGYVLKAVQGFRHKLNGEKILTVQQIKEAEWFLIRYSQKEMFKEEIKCVEQHRELPGNSELIGMNPWLDEEGILRGNSRLALGEDIPWAMKYPILLSRRDWLTLLIVRDMHIKLLHAGPGHVVKKIKQIYWIQGIRVLVNHVCRICSKCKRHNAKACQPPMGFLPKDRLGGEQVVFGKTTTDFAGPFYTMAGRGKSRNKRYLCIFTCMLTRAVHLEMAYDLSTDCFLLAYSRFTNKRGIPSKMWSDNGSNYIGGENLLRELVENLDKDQIKYRTRMQKVDWSFNPPAAPHFNGVHESLVKSSKRAMYKVLEGTSITDETLQTVMSEVERMLNSRPLTYVGSRDALTPLCPQNFLTGQMPLTTPVQDCVDFTDDVRKKWHYVQSLAGDVWVRWLKEWVSTLSPRSKWLKFTRDFKVDDVVLVVDTDMPRNRWSIGRILRTFPGADGHVRVVDVLVDGTVYRRPAVRLSLLSSSIEE